MNAEWPAVVITSLCGAVLAVAFLVVCCLYVVNAARGVTDD